MRVLVCGGRSFNDAAKVNATLDRLHAEYRFTFLLQGGSRGADYLAKEWAVKRRIKYQVYHANWRRYKKAAGPIRNALMLADGKPDLVVAFPGGEGTAGMVKLAKYNATKVLEIP
jgi:hypothetical protein